MFFDHPLYAELLNNLAELVYIFDEEGRIVFINHAAEKFEGLKLEEVRGLHVDDIYYQDYSPSIKALETGQKVVDMNNIYTIHGKQFRQITQAYPIFYEQKVIGVFTVQTDITSLERILAENIRLQRTSVKGPQQKLEFTSLIGKNAAFLHCIEIAKSAAKNDSAVLLSGPTGSGKEMFAKSIHNASSRSGGPYLAINCAAIPETLLESILFGTVKGSFTGAMDKPGLFEQAKGGTLFLDEINSMPLESQAKILRVLEEKECRRIGGDKDIKMDVRIISSINATPREVLDERILREDLFYRLAVISILIPPLRKRPEDITLLTEHFVEKYNQKFGKQITGLDAESHHFFSTFSWPGNVRQLKHTIESAIGMADDADSLIRLRYLPQYLFEGKIAIDSLAVSETVQSDGGPDICRTDIEEADLQKTDIPAADTRAADIPAADTPAADKRESEAFPRDIREQVRKEERQKIVQTLYECNGNVAKTARVLNMHRQSLIYKMKKYDIT